MKMISNTPSQTHIVDHSDRRFTSIDLSKDSQFIRFSKASMALKNNSEIREYAPEIQSQKTACFLDTKEGKIVKQTYLQLHTTLKMEGWRQSKTTPSMNDGTSFYYEKKIGNYNADLTIKLIPSENLEYSFDLILGNNKEGVLINATFPSLESAFEQINESLKDVAS